MVKHKRPLLTARVSMLKRLECSREVSGNSVSWTDYCRNWRQPRSRRFPTCARRPDGCTVAGWRGCSIRQLSRVTSNHGVPASRHMINGSRILDVKPEGVFRSVVGSDRFWLSDPVGTLEVVPYSDLARSRDAAPLVSSLIKVVIRKLPFRGMKSASNQRHETRGDGFAS